MPHDRIHAREPAHDRQRYDVGKIVAIEERDGHCVVTVADDGAAVELTVTLAVRDLFLDRLPIEEGESPVGQQIWYREHGG